MTFVRTELSSSFRKSISDCSGDFDGDFWLAFLFLNFEVPWETLVDGSKIDITDGRGFEEAALWIVSGVEKLELAVEVEETTECVDKHEEVKKELPTCLDEEL